MCLSSGDLFIFGKSFPPFFLPVCLSFPIFCVICIGRPSFLSTYYLSRCNLKMTHPTPSFPPLLPSPFLTNCSITSFVGKGPIWGDDWSHSFHQWPPSRGFLGFSSARRPVHSPQDHLIISLSLADRCDWRDTRGKWPLAKNPDRRWWHRLTSIMIF